jgi:hypothetical protein
MSRARAKKKTTPLTFETAWKSMIEKPLAKRAQSKQQPSRPKPKAK